MHFASTLLILKFTICRTQFSHSVILSSPKYSSYLLDKTAGDICLYAPSFRSA